MNDDISLLLEFLDRCGPEVHGCGPVGPVGQAGPAGLRDKQFALIERFIAGRCNEVECRELSEFLQLHPAWIRWIADRVSLNREAGESAAAEASEGDMRA